MANKKVFNPLVVGNFDTVRDDVADLTTRDHGSLTDLTADDHTQYALLAGRAGGQVLMGGTAAADTLTLRASADGLHTGNVTDGRLLFEDPITLLPTSRTYTTGTGNIISLTSTITLDVTNATTGAAYNFAPTVIYERASSAFGAGSLFLNGMTAKNAPTEANNISFIYSFIHSPTITADGATITNAGSQGFRYFPVWSTANAGTLNVTASHGAYIQASNIGSGVTVTDLYGVQYNDVNTLNGTLTNQTAIDIGALTKATNNIGIRNASPYVATPSATQVIDAASDTILANAELVRISNTTGAPITLTSNPTIADGHSGQKLYIISIGADNIVLTNGNNLRLPGAANLTLGQWDTVTLIWDTTDSQWIAFANSNQ